MRKILVLLLMFASIASTFGQTAGDGLKKRLQHQPLYLRGLWAEDALRFDAAGTLLSTSGETSFTLAGIDIRKVKLKSDALLIEGLRVGLELNGPSPRRVVLRRGRVPLGSREEPVKIEIARPASGDYGPALDAIFAVDLAELAPALPSWWQAYAHKQFKNVPVPAAPLLSAPDRPYRIGGSVSAPYVAKQVEPDFNDYARALVYQGKMVVRFLLDRNGTPSHFSIEQPLGLGLDERAIEAIGHYIFGPATMGGKSVAVELAVEVNFQIY